MGRVGSQGARRLRPPNHGPIHQAALAGATSATRSCLRHAPAGLASGGASFAEASTQLCGLLE
eukprot:5928793-Alexandrium_andersonii.AAC.1